MGRPTRFEPEMCEQARNYCLLGATNDELADFFHVSPSTIDRWIAGRADFSDAVKRGRVVADSRAARGLYDRAVGYERKVERSAIVGGELKPVTGTVHYPPNVQACIFWLRNRQRATWSARSAAPDSGHGGDSYDPIAELDAAGERAARELDRVAPRG
jgi:hypothetical protein